MAHTVEIFGSSIVVVGSFNPTIFSPEWLERNGLIGGEDAEVARGSQNMVVSRHVAAFSTEWFSLQVVENQFSLTSSGALSPAFKDLSEGILTLVPHTPVTALGLNFMGHYKMSSEADYHKVGDTLVPKGIWTGLIGTLTPGTADVTVKLQAAKRGEEQTTPDEIKIQVQPSARVKYGVFLSLNDHRAAFAASDPKKANAHAAARIVADDWEVTWHSAERAFNELLHRATQ